MTSAQIWIHGIIAAFIGGGANAFLGVISTGIVLPNQVNTGNGLHTAFVLMGVQFVLGGAIAVAMFLKQSPVPPGWDGVDTRVAQLPKP